MHSADRGRITAKHNAAAYACGAQLVPTLAPARLSLHLAATGLLINLAGVHLPRTTSTASRLFLGIDPIPGIAIWITPVLTIGITTFFLGLGYPGARTALIRPTSGSKPARPTAGSGHAGKPSSTASLPPAPLPPHCRNRDGLVCLSLLRR
ncbi:hypothetical protein [Saccharopolyspora gloriosae]|uniref:hypothetical protein n=1 Tax=Saccharopolyspora gloriosae TaxID=455344 RepID=UPI001FB68E57|nr:hypothetical protein [Saccharopolyspora gloriosae]